MSGRWPAERVLFAVAGTVVALSALLSVTVSVWFLLLTGFCPASLLLRRAGVERGCRW